MKGLQREGTFPCWRYQFDLQEKGGTDHWNESPADRGQIQLATASYAQRKMIRLQNPTSFSELVAFQYKPLLLPFFRLRDGKLTGQLLHPTARWLWKTPAGLQGLWKHLPCWVMRSHTGMSLVCHRTPILSEGNTNKRFHMTIWPWFHMTFPRSRKEQDSHLKCFACSSLI